MTPLGWLIMLCSVGGITSLFAWCIWRVLRTPQDHLEIPFESETPDVIQQRQEDA